jgi:demethylmenaquinone methyltransferase/2-methoxy-6-polyprenyl-1,4-benzoquinol methylase
MSAQNNDKTHFGYKEVATEEKAQLVGDIFHSVASKYDLMNDLMSFGSHRLWKRFAIGQSQVGQGDYVLDVAAGSGDLSREFAKRVGDRGRVIVTDINDSMLGQGRKNLVNQGVVGNVDYVQVDAEQLSFKDNTFDCVSIAFGLRNVTRIDNALTSMARVLKPGGRLLVLEFSSPRHQWLDRLYNSYSFKVIPAMGQMVTGDRDSYQYLVESIQKHPNQHVLKQKMLNAGFDEVNVFNLTGGIVALHVGYKY